MSQLFSFILILFSLGSCGRVSPLPEEEPSIDLSDSILSGSRYIKNQSFDLFQLEPWYIYDEENHIIWPNFNVYVVRVDGVYYKLQFIDYYDKQNLPGSYTIRLQEQGKPTLLWQFNAAACGNVYTNPDFDECMADPERNIFTYLNLKTQASSQMKNTAAGQSQDWHIAFNGTSVKINSGISGPGNVRVGLLYKYRPFYRGKNVNWREIANHAFGKKGEEFFNIDFDYHKVSFFLPQGVKRVINEPDWYTKVKNTPYLRKENNQNWWVLKHPEGQAFTKFRVKQVHESKLENDTIDTQLTLEYYLQPSGAEQFESTLRTWQLPLFNSATERIKWCLDFENQEIIDCAKNESWDLKVSVFNWDPLIDEDREWKLLVNEGAFGPISLIDMLNIHDGRE